VHTWKVMMMNVQELEEAHVEMSAYIQAENPDFLLVLEVDPAWLAVMSHLEEVYPYHLLEPRYSGRGIAFYSKLPWESAAVWDVVQMDRPALIASYYVDDCPLTIVGLHPYPPLNDQMWRLRNEELAQVAAFIRQQPGAAILLGDLNITPWSPTFQDILAVSNLQNGRSKFGFLPTWPVVGSTALLPFDHILTTPDLTITAMETGHPVGADHLPLTANIRFTSESTQAISPPSSSCTREQN
ncbi:MAG: endonuclease/exonuclease/phosphatase family protein, partial [Chloroflexota bacterium]